MVRFANPDILYLLFLIPVGIAFYVFVFRWKSKAMERFGNVELLQKLTLGVSRRRQILKAGFLLASIAFFILALARPQIGTKLEEVQREGVDIVVAVDVSLSMFAKDVPPSRLEKAKHEVSSLLKELRGDRIGIVAFAGDAFLHCPMTLDYGAARLFLESLEPGIIPEPGTAIDRALEVSMNAFISEERKHKVLILMTDGENHGGELDPLVERAETEGVVIYTVGVGSPEGVPIPVFDNAGRQTGFKKDRSGEVVLTKLDELSLRKIALNTGGKFYRASGTEQELKLIYEDISQMEKKELGAVRFSQYEDRFQYFLIIALAFLILEMLISERRKVDESWKGRFA